MGPMTADNTAFVKKTDRRKAKLIEPRQKRDTYNRTIHNGVCMTKSLMTTVHSRLIKLNCITAESHHERYKTRSLKPMMRIVCLSLSSFSTTTAFVSSETGKSWHIVSTRESIKETAT